MRLAFVLVITLGLYGCSSDEKPAPAPSVNACLAAGGTCAANFPFLCPPGDEQATDDARKTACGKAIGEPQRDVPCCLPGAPQDTGVPDTGKADTGAGDASTETGGDAASDATSDATPDATDALLDVNLDVNLDGG